MLLIPSIKLQAGQVIGTDGKPESRTAGDIIAQLADAGVTRLQLVDEDSFASERPGSLAIIEQAAARFDEVLLQVVTGVRDEEFVQAHLDAGADWLVLGHRAASAPHVLKDLCLEFPGHILISMNVRDGRMAGDAHSKISNHDIADLAEHFQSDGVHGIVYQDVDDDGNAKPLQADIARLIAEAVSVDVFVAGKIDSLEALEAACALAEAGLAGVIVNGALGAGMDLAAAHRIVEGVG